MTQYIRDLLNKHRNSGILLDANILLLYFIGTLSPELIPRFKRTKQFAIEDYGTLRNLLALFSTVVTTPNILTEVSNLSGQLGEPLKSAYFSKFAQGIDLLEEYYPPSKVLATMPSFQKFGLTDVSILSTAGENYLVLTDDFRLSQYLQTVGVDVLNFNHIREINW